jgi:hypothetical protein
MKLFELVLFQSCNYSCKDCPMKKWLYKPDAVDDKGVKRNGINNELLFEWLDKYLDPKEWFIEITGGEPGLYPEIKTLITGLIRRNYKGIIRTNGSQNMPMLPSFKLVSAWHKGKDLPKYYNFIVILENPDDDWKKKEEYCKDNNIPYAVFPYKFFSTDCSQTTEYPPSVNRIFSKMTTMFSSGAITGCFGGGAVMEHSLQKMSEPIIYDLLKCPTCGNVTAAEYFINSIPGFKNKMKIVPDKELARLSEPLTRYPILNVKNEWINRDGEVVGKLGDDLNELNEIYGGYGEIDN